MTESQEADGSGSEAGERPWRDEDVLRRLLQEQGMTTHEAGEHLGVSQTTVSKWARRFDIESSASVTASDCAKFRRLKREGKTITEIADRDDVSSHWATVDYHQSGQCSHDDPEGEEPIPGRINATDPEDCARYRRMIKIDGVTSEMIAEEAEQGGGGVRYHAYGRCQCDVDEPPAESPISNVADPITPEGCATIREQYRDGKDVEEIAEEWPHHQGTINTHTFGGCHHDDEEVGVPPCTSRHYVSADQCADLRREYDAGSSTVEITEERGIAHNTVCKHVFGYCGHSDPGEPPAETPHDEDRVTAERCAALRERARIEGLNATELAEVIGKKYDTVKNHIYGHCRHTEEIPVEPVEPASIDDHPQAKIDADLCGRLRWRYKMGVSVREMASNLPCSYRTVQTHTFGYCAHEIDESPPEPRSRGERRQERANPQGFSADSDIAPESHGEDGEPSQ